MEKFLMEATMLLNVEENRVRKENKLKKKDSYVSYLSEPYVFLALNVANLNNDKQTQEECLKILMNSKAVMDTIMYRVNNYYGYYGCEELRFVYDNIDRDEFIVYVWEAVREHLKKFNGSYFPRTANDVLDLSQKTFEKRIASGIFRVAQWAYRDMLITRCHEYGMEQMNSNHLSDYAIIRKVCEYEVDLHNTNEEIIMSFENHWKNNHSADETHKRSMGSKDIDETVLNRIRKGFSFVFSRDKEVHMEQEIINKEALKYAFNYLTESQREIITLHYFTNEKNTFAKIGEMMGLSEDQVRYQEKKALSLMRSELER